MEFLFILFVLYMIFSAVARGLRAAAAQKNPPQQQSARDFPDLKLGEDTKLSTEPAGSVWSGHLYPDEPLLQQETVVDEKHYVPGQRMKPSMREKQSRKDELPSGARSQQREVSSRPIRDKKGPKQTAQPKRGLDYLIRSKNLPLAIIAAEVISPPRSKKPYSQRNRI